MWSHQYDQQVNQVQCTINQEHGWSTNGPESNLFGLEPNYGCCTSNMHQGWPKFVSHLWLRTAEDERRLRELLDHHGERDSLGYFALRRDKAARRAQGGHLKRIAEFGDWVVLRQTAADD